MRLLENRESLIYTLSMKIRRATGSDKRDLIALLLDFYHLSQKAVTEKQAKFRAYKDPHKTAEENANKYLFDNYICFVGEEGEVLVGFIVGQIKEKEDRVYGKEGFVEKWFVAKNHQNEGIGKELFNKMEEEFKKADCTHILLDTHVENAHALQIYENMGFNKRLVTLFKTLKNLP